MSPLAAAKRHGFGLTQLVSLALIGAGCYGMWHEPQPKDPALLAAHLLHYKIQATLVGAGLLFFNPNRARKGLMALSDAWKGRQ
jgi:hypothetical protein